MMFEKYDRFDQNLRPKFDNLIRLQITGMAVLPIFDVIEESQNESYTK